MQSSIQNKDFPRYFTG